jgi:predicted nucleic acid-binding protein
MADPLDTNVVVRYFVEDPEAEAYRDVFRFFEKLERGERRAMLPPLVLFQTYFVLTSYYEVPRTTAAGRLRDLLSFRGLGVPEKPVLRRTLDILVQRSTGLVDAYLAALCMQRGLKGIYSLDGSLRKLGVDILPLA